MKTNESGRINEFSVLLNFGEFNRDEEINSFDDNRNIKSIAISAPPIPTPTPIVIVIAVDAAVVVAALDTKDSIVEESTIPTIYKFSDPFNQLEQPEIAKRQEREQEEV